jgi:hypothetical protein
MALSDWNWRLPAEMQDVPWDCAAASLTWCLNTIGRNTTEAEVVAGLGPSRINAAYGLLDASGAGLVDYLSEIGITAYNNPSASWQELLDAAGYQPVLAGGRTWCHWTGVRISNQVLYPDRAGLVALANPAPGWMGVDQLLDQDDFERLGAFSVVWFAAW